MRRASALARVRQRLGQPRERRLDRAAAEARPPHVPIARLLLREGTKVHVIPAEALDVAEARDDFVCLCSGGREFLKQQTLAEPERQLDPACFVRVYRSFIVNVGRVTRIERYSKDGRLAALADGSNVPASRAGLSRLRGMLGQP